MNDENEENTFECQYCHLNFDSSNELEDHVLSTHFKEVEENLAKIRTIAEEHSETISEWRDSKRRELLLEIANKNPRLLHELQTSPHADEILDKEISMELLRKALKTNTLDSFSAMFLKHPRFEEFYEAERRHKPEHQPKTGQSTGQDETFYESPDSMISTTKTTNIRENLSEEDQKKLVLTKILYSILRNKKK